MANETLHAQISNYRAVCAATRGPHFAVSHMAWDRSNAAYRAAAFEAMARVVTSDEALAEACEGLRPLDPSDVLCGPTTRGLAQFPNRERVWPLVGTLMCRTSELAVVAENPNPGRIEHLWPIDNGGTGRDSYVPAKALKDALKRPAFANLRGLRVTHGGSLGSVLTAIAKPLGGHLEDLWLFDTQGSASVGPKQLDALSTNFGALRTLSLGANKATGEHLTELCGAVGGFLAEHPLESLVLHFQRTTSSHLEQLLPSSCPWLRRLELPLLRANDAVFDLLEGMHSLRTLRLFAFTGGPDDVHALLRRPVARRLHRLQVSWPDHVRFAETELSSLRALSFSGQTLDAFREEAPFRETLEELQLTNLAPDAQQLEELAQMFPKLRRVFANGSGDGGSQWSRLGRPIQSTGSLWLRT